MEEVPGASCVLSWEKTAGAAALLLRVIGGRNAKEAGRSKPALAVEAMKATLDGCSAWKMKREDLVTAGRCPRMKPIALAPAASNCLKRPASAGGAFEGQSRASKRT